jgi:hypothetical protein
LNNSGSSEDDYANKVIPIRNNDMVIIGQKDPSGLGRKSMYLARYDETGFQQSSQSLGDANDEEGYSGVRTMEGGIAFVGYTTSYGVANKDAMLVYLRYDSTITALYYDVRIFIETLSPVGVDEISSYNEIKLYPNPNNGIITISSKDNENEIYSIYDLLGKCIYTGRMTGKISKVDLSSISNGMYILKIKNSTLKMIKQ